MKSGLSTGTRKAFANDYLRDRTFSAERLAELARRSVPFQRRLLEQLRLACAPLVGNPFPKTWEAMRAPDLTNSITDPELAIPWTVAKITAYHKRLNGALASRREMEHALLSGRPEECETQLGQFEDGWGRSLWSLDMRFVAAQFARGFHGNRTTLRQFGETCGSDWVSLLAQNSSFRALLNTSTKEYLETVGMMVPQIRADELSAYVFDYLRYRFYDEVPTTETAICNVLHFESRHSILDLYESAVRILSRILRRDRLPRTADATAHLTRDVSDSRLVSLASVASDGATVGEAGDNPLYECLERFAWGDGADCFALCRDQLVSHPTALIWYDLLAASAVLCGNMSECPGVFPEEAPGQLVLQGLHDWYSARVPRRQSIEELRRLARALRPTHLGPALTEFVSLFDQQQSTLGRDCLGLLAVPLPVPQFAYGFEAPGRARVYVAGLRRAVGATAGVAVVEEYHRLLDNPTQPAAARLPQSEQLRFKAAAYHAVGRWQDVADTLRELRTLAPAFSRSHPELLVCEAEALLGMGEWDRAATVLGDLFCEDRKMLPPILLRRVAAILKNPKFKPASINLGWPILAAAAHKDDRLQLSLDRVHDFVGDYIEAEGSTKPTELLERATALPLGLLVFLKECCTPEILESSIWFSSYEELLKDRLRLCERLIDEIDQGDHELQREIAALTRQLAILDLTSQIQRSRIFIDTDTILQNIDEATWSQTNSLLTVRALRNNELQRGLKLLRLPNTEGGKVTVVLIDEGKAFFETVFDKIKHLFLYSPELGLDANLSQRVRHGTLAGELRAIFDRVHLSTKTRSDGSYEPNAYWCDALGGPWHTYLTDDLNAAFRDFSMGLDAEIRSVRENWVQIKSESKLQGLFDYAFTGADLDRLLNGISPLADHEDVHELITQALLERTEACLADVRSAVTSRLAPALEKLLDALVSSVEGVGARHGISVVSLRNVVTQCKTELVRQLEKIQGWFYVENRHEQKPFRFRDLVESVEEVLNRISTPCDVSLEESPPASLLIRGSYFRPLWDLLVILFDNASRHSGVSSVAIRLRAEFKPEKTVIKCSNQTRKGFDLELLRAKAQQLNRLSLSNQSDLNKLRQEGGSGTAKLHKIVRHELGRDQHGYEIAFGVTEANEFEVLITLGAGLSNADTPDRG